MNFAEQVRRAIEKHKVALDKTLQQVVLEAHNSIVAKTPVDKGNLQGSWQVDKANPKWGEAVMIYTGEVYAPVVEYGLYPAVGSKTVDSGDGIYSRQAPQGMVRLTAKEMKSRAEEIWAQYAP